MTPSTDSRNKFFKLRMRAESALEQTESRHAYPSGANSDDVRKLLHELQVQNIELEMQDEALARSQLEADESRDKYPYLPDFSPVAVLTLDANGLIVDVNLTAARLLGKGRDSLCGRPFFRLVSHEYLDAFYAYHRQVLEGPCTQTCEITMLRRDGSAFHAQLDGIAIRSDESGQTQSRVVLTDITDRKRQEESVQTREHSFRTVFQKHDAVMLLIEPHTGQIIDANYAAQRYYGYNLSQLRRMTIQQINTLPPDDVARERTKALQEERNYFHFPHRLASGDVRTVEVHSSPIELGESRILFSIIHDITERKKAEERLVASEEKFRLIFEASPDAISLTRERDAAFLDVNRVFQDVSGYTRSEALSSNPTDLDLWAQPEDRQRLLEQLAAMGHVENYEALFRRKDGSPFSGLVSAVRLTVDGEPSVLAITKSIEAQKRAEADLKIQRDNLAAVFDTAPFIMMVVNEHGRVVNINRAGASFRGRSKEQLLGVLFGEVFGCIYSSGGLGCEREGPCTTCPIRSRVWRTFKTGEPVFGEEGTFTVRKGSDEVTLHLLISTALLSVTDSDAVLVTLEDITDRKRAEEEKALLQKQLLLAQKMESIGTLAGGIAHDFNNILQVVLGYSDMLLLAKKNGEPDYEELHAIRQAGRDGSELAKRILAFSHRQESNARPICLNAEIRRLERMLRRTIPRMIEIELNLADDPVTVNADPGQMEQVLLNLVVNAQHAMPDGGRLIIETDMVNVEKNARQTHMEVEPGEYVLLTVSDTGCGMNRDIVDRIFEPFFTTKEPGQGTGLGLAMVYGIVRSHRGHITCSTEKDSGTSFRIYLPAIEQEIEQAVEKTQQMLAFGSETILLVDDEMLIRMVGEKNLSRAGYSVLSASNGHEALQVYQANREKIGLVLLDMIMPEMGGKQCLEELLKIDPSVKVLVASGYAVDGLVKDCIKAGVKGFICKPYEVKDLLTTIRRILDESEE